MKKNIIKENGSIKSSDDDFDLSNIEIKDKPLL